MFLSLITCVELWAQMIPGYEDHKFFDTGAYPGSSSEWYVGRNADGTLASALYEAVTAPFTRDVSLFGESQPHQFTPLPDAHGRTLNFLYRLHHPYNLFDIFSFKVSAALQSIADSTVLQILPNYAGLQMNESYALLQLNMGQYSMCLINDTLMLMAPGEPWHAHELIQFDDSGQTVYRRRVLYGSAQAFAPGWVNTGSYQLRNHHLEDDRILLDYQFSDSVHVVGNGDTTAYYCENRCIWIGAQSGSTPAYGSVLQPSAGNLTLLESFIKNGNAYRVYSITGSTDISAGDIPWPYLTSDNIVEVILVKYTQGGNVEWAQVLNRFTSDLPEITYNASAHAIISGSTAVIRLSGSHPPNNGQPVGGFEAFANGEVVDSGVLADTNPFLTIGTPMYLISINLETGGSIGVHRLRRLPESMGFGNPGNITDIVSHFNEESIALSINQNGNELPSGHYFDLIYPSVVSLSAVSPAAMLPLRLLKVKPELPEYFESYQIPRTTSPIASTAGQIYFTATPLNDNQILISGGVSRNTTLHFSNEDLPLETGVITTNRAAMVIKATLPGLDVDDSLSQQSRQLYPNPSSDKVYLSGFNEPVRYMISDLTGKMVARGIASGEGISVGNLQGGMYILHIVMRDGELIRTRFVKV